VSRSTRDNMDHIDVPEANHSSRTGMATIKETGHRDPRSHGSNQGCKDIVIADLSSGPVVNRNKRLVETILFVSVVVTQFTTVSRVMDKDSIACLGSRDEVAVGLQDVVAGRISVFAVVHQDGNVGFLKAVDILDVILHVAHIIVAATQFTLLAHIVDT
jgi:hypothetical protein